MAVQDRLDKAIDAALVDRIVGCVVLVSRAGEPVYARAAGLADREAGLPMEQDAIFRLASVTKPVVAAAALAMVDLGLLQLDDLVRQFLDDFRPRCPDGSEAAITIRQLLSHTSGLTYPTKMTYSHGLAGPILPFDENLRRMAEEPLAFPPGTGWAYGVSTDVLGGVIAAINGSDLATTVARYVTKTLGMVDSHFGVSDAARLAVPYRDGPPPIRMEGEVIVVGRDGGVTPFSVPRIFNAQAPQSGGAGMAGTAGDVMRLLEALREDFLSPPLRAQAFSNQIGDLPRGPGDMGKRFGFLGAVVADPVAAQTAMPVGAVDWGGAWGHNWVVDLGSQTTIVCCTNTLFEGCNGPFREEIADAVFG
jgi:CubicO group peptidase (beta-lactamase class C family)